MAAGDQIADDALALARVLRRLPGGSAGKIFGSAMAAAERLEPPRRRLAGPKCVHCLVE